MGVVRYLFVKKLRGWFAQIRNETVRGPRLKAMVRPRTQYRTSRPFHMKGEGEIYA